MARKIIDPKKHYLKRVKQTSTCWLWLGGVDASGYGTLNYDGEWLAHRLFFKLFVDSDIKGFYVLHTCDNPRCVNPAHLFKGTQDDNMKDMVSKGRQSRLVGVNNGRSKLTLNQVKSIRSLKGKEFQRVTAERFGISQITVSNIQINKTWL